MSKERFDCCSSHSSKLIRAKTCCKTRCVSVCLDCREYYCPACTTAHLRFKVSQHHDLCYLEFGIDEDDVKLKRRTHCPNHPHEEAKLHCQNCEETVCETCMVTNHCERKFGEPVANEGSQEGERLKSKWTKRTTETKAEAGSGLKSEETEAHTRDNLQHLSSKASMVRVCTCFKCFTVRFIKQGLQPKVISHFLSYLFHMKSFVNCFITTRFITLF